MCARFRPHVWLVLILLLAFALRMVVSLSNLDTALAPDERGYLNRAVLAASDIGRDTDVFRPPLYPYTLSLWFKTIGDERFLISTYNALLDLASVALLYVLTRLAIPRPSVAVLGAFLFAVFPPALGLTGALLSEPLFICLMLAGLVVVLDSVKRFNVALAFLGGALLALAALTREVIAYFALLVIPVWWILFTPVVLRTRVLQAVVLLGGMILVLTPWVIRNAILEKRFLLISTSGEFNFVRDNVRVAILFGDEASDAASTNALNQQVHAELDAQPASERAGYAYRRGLQLIAQSGWAWLASKAASLAAFWNPFQFEKVNLGITSLPSSLIPIASLVVTCFLLALIVFSTLGFIAAPDNAAKLLLALFLLYSFVLFILTHYQLRYRYPLQVLMLPYMAYGMWGVGKVIGTRALSPQWIGARRLALALIPLTLFGLLILIAAGRNN